nr:PREDICTED: psoriasis susceptibility 1 candidate gene 2 protein [Anolis carolinensis]|eukprot:XP_003217970.2 PREDICTED: psoriasis susceptibility 1 candidate gene 2 protein [Anolis carolinensis]
MLTYIHPSPIPRHMQPCSGSCFPYGRRHNSLSNSYSSGLSSPQGFISQAESLDTKAVRFREELLSSQRSQSQHFPQTQVYIFLWCLTMSSGHSGPGAFGGSGVPPVPKPDNPLGPVPEKPWPEGPPKPEGPQPLGPLVPGKPWPKGPPVSPDPKQPRSPQPPNPLGPTNPGPFPGPSSPPKPPLPDDPYPPFPLVPVAPWPPLPEWDDSGKPPKDSSDDI